MNLNYDSISPFTGNAAVLEEPVSREVTLMLCTDTGYHTYKGLWVPDSEYVSSMESSMDEETKKSKKIENGCVWYYYTAIDTTNGISVIPDVSDSGVKWKVNRLKPKTNDDEIPLVSFSVPGSSDIIDYVRENDEYDTFESFSDALNLYSALVYKMEQARELAKSEIK